MRRFYRRRWRRRGRFEWLRDTINNASPNATLNTIDLMANYKSHLGISVNLPEISIWRLRLKISITISQAAALAANDGVLVTVFTDGQNQTLLNQLTNGYDERDMLYNMMYSSEYAFNTAVTGASSELILYKEFDIKTHRSLRSVDDTLFLQLAASGQTQITGYSVSVVNLIKVGR